MTARSLAGPALPRTRPRPSRPAFALAALLGAYALTIPLPNNLLVPDGIRLAIYNYRPWFIVALVGGLVALGLVVRRSRLQLALRRRSIRGLLGAGLLFPVYYAIVALLGNRFSLPVVGLYFCWALFSFLIVPAWLRTRRELSMAVALIAAAAAANVAYAWLFGSREINPFGPGRISYSYLNPNYFAQIAQTLALSFGLLLLLRQRRPTRGLLIAAALVAVICLALVLEVRARNVLVALLTALVCYRILRRGWRRVVLLLGLFGLVLLASLIAVLNVEFEALDEFSSNRFYFWREILGQMSAPDSWLRNWTIGLSDAAQSSVGGSYDDLGASKAFHKLHVDNFFLELLVEGGLIGLALFLLPYVLILRMAAKRLAKRGAGVALAAFVAAAHLSVAAQGLFTATIPSFNAPVGFWIAVLGVAPLLVEPPATPPVGRAAPTSGAPAPPAAG